MTDPGEGCQACGRPLVIAERYALQSLQGRGSGKVYSATRQSDQTEVAIKVLSLDNSDWKDGEQFERGATIMKGLEHPSLPRVYDFAQDELGKLFLVREYLADDTLEERVRKGRSIEPKSFRALLFALLRTARYLHGLVPALVHRDIKPNNIMFRSESSWAPVLVDFDHVAAAETQDAELILPGMSEYAAPEQRDGHTIPASDLYSIGMTAAFVATRKTPDAWSGEHGMRELETALSSIDGYVRDVILKLCQTNPADRYASASEALAALEPKAEEPEVLPHIGADEMSMAEVEMRINGWLTAARQKNPRLLIPYLARLDQLGYEMVRDRVASAGGIQRDQLDRAVYEARTARQVKSVQPHTHLPQVYRPQHPVRRTPRGRTPNTGGGGCATLFSLVMVIGVGLTAFFAANIGQDAGNQYPPPPCIDTKWLSVQSFEDNRICIYWSGRQTVRIGCTDNRQHAAEVCTQLADVPNGAPVALNDAGARALIGIAEDANLEGIATPDDIMMAGTASSTAPTIDTLPPESIDTTPVEVVETPPDPVDAPKTIDATPEQPKEAAPMVEILLESTPVGALVKIGDQICSTPCTVHIPRGERFEAVFELNGYVSKTQKVRAYSTKTVTVTLEKR